MSPSEGRPRDSWASGCLLPLALLLFGLVLGYLAGYIVGHDHGYDKGFDKGYHEKVLDSVVTTTTTQKNLIPPIAEVDPTHTGQHGKPVCGDYNGDGVPDSPSGDPPPGKDRVTDCYPYGTGR